MKLTIECKKKKCIPPFVWQGSYKNTIRAKVLICGMCKYSKSAGGEKK